MHTSLDCKDSRRSESLRALGWGRLWDDLPSPFIPHVAGGKFAPDVEAIARETLASRPDLVISMDRLKCSTFRSSPTTYRHDMDVVDSMATIDLWTPSREDNDRSNRIYCLLETAAFMVEVRLLIVERSHFKFRGGPEDEKEDVEGNVRWRWFIHTPGVLDFMHEWIIDALRHLLRAESARARKAITEILARHQEDVTDHNANGIASLVTALLNSLTSPLSGAFGRPESVATPTVMTAGGKTARFVPLLP